MNILNQFHYLHPPLTVLSKKCRTMYFTTQLHKTLQPDEPPFFVYFVCFVVILVSAP